RGFLSLCRPRALPLALVQHELLPLPRVSSFRHSEYVASAPTRIGHLASRQGRNQPRQVARLASLRCNDDVGSHALPCLFQRSIKGTAGIRVWAADSRGVAASSVK